MMILLPSLIHHYLYASIHDVYMDRDSGHEEDMSRISNLNKSNINLRKGEEWRGREKNESENVNNL